MITIQDFVSRLKCAKKNGMGWMAKCPAHDDRKPSLSVSTGTDGRVLIHCHSGCAAEAIVGAMGLKMRDLMPVDRLTVDRIPRSRLSSVVSSTSTPKHAPKTYATASDAVAELERRHGKRSAIWTYRDAEGEPVGVVVRWDRPGRGKDLRPVSRTPEGWIIGGMVTPRPLYCLPDLVDADRVFICEGEKAVDAVRTLGLIATTWPHGSKSASKADWSPLAGKECVVLPDNDDAGRLGADDVVGLLAKVTPAPTVKRIELPGLPPGGDAVEYIAARREARGDDAAVRDEMERLADAAKPIELERSAPTIMSYRPFPVEVLPEPIGSFVAKGAQAIGCDAAYIALPMLSALAAAIGNTRRIQLKRGWTEPAIVWTAIVGESGTRKSPALELPLRPVRKRQRDAMREHGEAMKRYRDELLRYERDLAQWKRGRDQGDPPAKPDEPIADRFWCDDTTIEALAVLLLRQPRGLLMVQDELAGWLGGFDRYRKGGGRSGGDAAKWLEMHGGRSMIVDRKTSGVLYIPRAAVSIAGGIQPRTLVRALGVEHREDGMLARLLLACPPRLPNRWTEAEVPASTEMAVSAIFDRLYGLEPEYDDDGNFNARIVTLTSGGKTAWIEFYNSHAREQAKLTGDLAAAWSKLEGYAARFALIVHLVRWAADDPTLTTPNAVDRTSIAAGITLSRWFGREAKRVYSLLAETDEDRDRRRLVELIDRKGGAVTPRDLMRSSRSFATAANAEAALDELANVCLGNWEHAPPGPSGGKPSKRFVLAGADGVDNTPRQNPVDSVDVDDTPAGDPVKGGIVNCQRVNAPENVGIVNAPDGASDGEADGDEWGKSDGRHIRTGCRVADRIDPPRHRTTSPRGPASVSSTIGDDAGPG